MDLEMGAAERYTETISAFETAYDGLSKATLEQSTNFFQRLRDLESAYHELRGVPHIAEHPNATLLHVCAGNKISMAELNLASDSSSLIEANVRQQRHRLPGTQVLDRFGPTLR